MVCGTSMWSRTRERFGGHGLVEYILEMVCGTSMGSRTRERFGGHGLVQSN